MKIQNNDNQQNDSNIDKKYSLKEKISLTLQVAKIKKGNIMLAILFAVVVIWLVVEVCGVVNVDYETTTATQSEVYEEVDAKALFVRNEHIIPNDSGAVTVPYVSNGEKVKAGGKVAMVFSSEDTAKNYLNYINLERELNYYKNMQKSSVGQVTDVESLNKEILSNVNNYIRSNFEKDFNSSKNYADDLNEDLTKIQILTGENIDFGTIINELNSKIEDISPEFSKPNSYVYSDASGTYSFNTDGCESFINFDILKDLDVNSLNNYIEKVSKAKPTKDAGKIVNDYDSYICVTLDTKIVKKLKQGENVKITLKNSDDVLNCTVYSDTKVPVGQKNQVVIFRCNEMNSKISSLRVEDISIRINTYKGIKLPISAVHYNDDGETGCYALVSSVCEWRKADILYKDDNFVVLSFNPEEKGGIKLHDEIITKGKDLHDGKFYD